MRRLVVCLDGTWNVVDHTTNVWRMYALLAGRDAEGNAQLKYYDEGVGSRWYDSITGGAFGAGVYRNVKQAYNWLSETYTPGDKLYLFGFSRGALTALSLANLIDRCGLIGPTSTRTFEDAYRMYEMPGFERGTRASKCFRAESADWGEDGTLAFLGLFDTVSSLYAHRFTGESMHRLSLPGSVKQVYHAMALDENRRPFASVEFPCAPRMGRLCERWFSGAHANVGGGYSFDPLSLVPLSWMLEAASTKGGLKFRGIPRWDLATVMSAIERNSHDEFAFGIPAALSAPIPLLLRKRRTIGRNAIGAAEEWIDATAVARFNHYARYRRTCRTLSSFLGTSREIEQGEIDVRNYRPSAED